jgi:hypothetical protein
MILTLASCATPSEITPEVEGRYKYTYPSGQIEILIMKHDSTFDQIFYSNEKDFSVNSEPLCNSSGKWSISESLLQFNPWLTICYLSANVDSILPNPEYTDKCNVPWFAPTKEHRAEIGFYLDHGYILTKID